MSDAVDNSNGSQESVDSNVDQSSESSGEIQQSADGLATEADINADPTLSKQEKVQAKKMLKELKIKFNGKDYMEQLPFEIPDDEASINYMRDTLQMKKLSQSKSQETANLQKEVTQFITELRKNPRKTLSDPRFGVDLKKIAAEMIEEEIENSKKSPEQIEKEKMSEELRAMKEEREKEKEEFKKREFERLQEQEYERYDMLMTKTLDSSDLPKSPYVVKKMADYLLLGLTNGIDITPEDVLPLVREEIQNDLKEMFAAMPEDIVESFIGKDNFNRVRKKQLSKAKQAQAAPKSLNKQVVDTGSKTSEKKTKETKQNMRTFFGF